MPTEEAIIDVPVVLTCANNEVIDTSWRGKVNGKNRPLVDITATSRNRIVKATVQGVEYDLNAYPMFITDDPEQVIALPIPVPSIPLTPPT